MKKIIIGVFLTLVLLIGGYFIYRNTLSPDIYQLTLNDELDKTEFDIPKDQMKQFRETYQVDGLGWFTANILEYSDISSAEEGVSKLKKMHNPSMIVLNTKYVNYYADPASSESYHHHFYQSGKNIVFTNHTGTKDNADAFIIWYYSKYPNQ